jgi:hypothetical protein
MITSVAGDTAEAGQGFVGYTGDNVPATTTFLSDAFGVPSTGMVTSLSPIKQTTGSAKLVALMTIWP